MSLTYTKERRMCCRHSLFSFLLLNMFKKFVLMSVYHFIPGPTLRRLVPPLLPPLSGGSYLACGNKAKANNFFSFYSASSNRKIKFSIFVFFFFCFNLIRIFISIRQTLDEIHRYDCYLTIFGNYFKDD